MHSSTFEYYTAKPSDAISLQHQTGWVISYPSWLSGHWVKADMISTVSFDRLSLPYRGKNISGKRDYFVKNYKGGWSKKHKGCVLYALHFLADRTPLMCLNIYCTRSASHRALSPLRRPPYEEITSLYGAADNKGLHYSTWSLFLLLITKKS